MRCSIHSIILCSSLFAVICLALGEEAASESNWIYKYSCNTKKGNCGRIRVEENKIESNEILYDTLNICRMVCGEYGSLWPIPTIETTLSKEVIAFHPNFIRFDLPESTTELKHFFDQISFLFLKNLNDECEKNCTSPSTQDVYVSVRIRSNVVKLNRHTDEAYTLDITTTSARISVLISAENPFGARHGLETLSQLVTLKKDNQGRNGLVIISKARILDKPKFGHRGLLLDTARNFIPLADILRTLDGMASVKLNVFHWHITDSQSFPLEIPRLPMMSRYGAYSENEIYKKTDVQLVVNYAKFRGIRVIMEFDSPAHAGNGFQWGPEYGMGDLAVCVNQQPWRSYCIEPPCGQLNPVNPNLYKVLKDIYLDIYDMIEPDELFHMGGDEVFFNCWNTTKEITDLLAARGHGRETVDFLQLWAEYQSASLKLWDEITGNTPSSRVEKEPPNPAILWSSHLTDYNVIEKYLQKDRYIIQTWVKSDDVLPQELMKKGYQLIMSTKNAWYLDHGFWGVTSYYSWRTVYKNRIPTDDLVLGGEVCLWSEFIDENSMDSRIWPRAAAAAERLWSDPRTDPSLAETRFYRHRERLISKSIKPEAVTPEYCTLNEGECK